MIGVYVIVAVVLVILVAIAMSVRVTKQYERVARFELGKVKDGARGPGLIFQGTAPRARSTPRRGAARCLRM
jgi:regulator of protease activity HflC (stomatin/prohibitin superfamily)